MRPDKRLLIPALAVVLAGSALFVLSGLPGEQPVIEACREKAIAAGRIARRNTHDMDFAVEEAGEGRWTVTSRSFACEVENRDGGLFATVGN